MEIWEPKPPGNLWATPGLLGDSFTFYLYILLLYIQQLALLLANGFFPSDDNPVGPKRSVFLDILILPGNSAV
jgi:hypothetical protein